MKLIIILMIIVMCFSILNCFCVEENPSKSKDEAKDPGKMTKADYKAQGKVVFVFLLLFLILA